MLLKYIINPCVYTWKTCVGRKKNIVITRELFPVLLFVTFTKLIKKKIKKMVLISGLESIHADIYLIIILVYETVLFCLRMI